MTLAEATHLAPAPIPAPIPAPVPVPARGPGPAPSGRGHSGAAGPLPTADAVDAVVGVLGAHLLDLAARAPGAPSLVRISAGDVTVEIGWPGAATSLPAGTLAAGSVNGAGATQGTGSINGAGVVQSAGSANGAGGGQAGAVGQGAEVNGSGPVAGGAAGETAGAFTVTSPSVGMFYRAPEPGKPPFVAEGDVVRTGQQVGIVEAMKLMIPIEADRGGRVVRVLAEDACAIEHDQPLFLLVPADGAS